MKLITPESLTILVSTIVTNRLINITLLRKKRVSAVVVNCKSMNILTNSVGSMLLSSTKRIGLIPEQHCNCVNTYIIPTVIKSIAYYRFRAFCMSKEKYNTATAISNFWLWVNSIGKLSCCDDHRGEIQSRDQEMYTDLVPRPCLKWFFKTLIYKFMYIQYITYQHFRDQIFLRFSPNFLDLSDWRLQETLEFWKTSHDK